MAIIYKVTVSLGEKKLEAQFEAPSQMDQRVARGLLVDALAKQFKVVLEPDFVFTEESK